MTLAGSETDWHVSSHLQGVCSAFNLDNAKVIDLIDQVTGQGTNQKSSKKKKKAKGSAFLGTPADDRILQCIVRCVHGIFQSTSAAANCVFRYIVLLMQLLHICTYVR